MITIIRFSFKGKITKIKIELTKMLDYIPDTSITILLK